MNWREMPRPQQVVIFVIGTLEDLCQQRVLSDGRYRLSESARHSFEEMKAEAFTPRGLELVDAMKSLQLVSEDDSHA